MSKYSSPRLDKHYRIYLKLHAITPVAFIQDQEICTGTSILEVTTALQIWYIHVP